MSASFLFYDLETSGFDPRYARIMQFAGQRTDMDLNPIGEPVNCYIKMTPDTVPDPDAVLITGITPQKTISDGYSEAEFLKIFHNEVATPGTVMTGFNNIRFDDEFIRFLNYRNFYDAYEWHWESGRDRWDILDMIRMTRALKPEGIEWPFASDGKPSNRLELLTSVNKLKHDAAHDALSDVQATIDVAKLIKTKQPQLFNHLFNNRTKAKVRSVVESKKPFMYTSGRFPSSQLHTTACIFLGRSEDNDYALVYDLRYDPDPFMHMSAEEIIEAWKYDPETRITKLPVKTLKYNRAPAILPGVVKDQATLNRIQLDIDTVTENLQKLLKHPAEFVERLFEAVKKMDQSRYQKQLDMVDNQLTVEARLYDGFISDEDKKIVKAVQQALPQDLASYQDRFKDSRLNNLLPIYKARNFPKLLFDDERNLWEKHCAAKLLNGGEESRLAKYFARIQDLAETRKSANDQYLLEELKLYGESIIPDSAAD